MSPAIRSPGHCPPSTKPADVFGTASNGEQAAVPMPIEEWSDRILLVNLQDDPQFTDDMNALNDLIERRDGADVLLEFSGVNFLNSSNIAKLLKLRKILSTGKPGRMKLCGVSTSVWGVFLVTGLDKIFELADDVATGLAMLQIDPGNASPSTAEGEFTTDA